MRAEYICTPSPTSPTKSSDRLHPVFPDWLLHWVGCYCLLMIFSVSFMNEFSHFQESQNSVIITDLLFVSLSFLPFYNQIRVFHFAPHSGIFGALHFKRWLCSPGRERAWLRGSSLLLGLLVRAHKIGVLKKSSALFQNWNFRFNQIENNFK